MKKMKLLCIVSFLVVAIPLNAQKITISGVVIDNVFNEPIIGASVMEKGTDNGTVTDVEGKYTLSISVGAQLHFSYMGYVSQEVTVKDQRKINISLQENTELLDEVVVVGYGSSKKRDITTSIAKLKAIDVAQRDVTTANQLLQGQLSGVNITMANGLPGSKPNVSIRGISSINGDNQPLYVIDGIQISKSSASYTWSGEYRQDPLSMINSSDIESIDVLKDAAASAIYGSRATNGVIIITTKKGKSGVSSFQLSQMSGFQILPRKLNLMTSDQYIALQKEAVVNYNTGLNLSPKDKAYVDINKVLGNIPANYYDVNWQDFILNENAQSHQTDFSFSGGNDHTKAFASFGYLNQDAILKLSGLERYSVRTNVDMNATDKLLFGVRMSGSYTQSTSAPNGHQGTALFQRSLEQRPYDRPYKEDGSYYIGGKDILRHNGVQVLNNESNKSKNYQLLLSAFGEFSFLENFTFHTAYNTEIRQGYGTRRMGMFHPYAFGRGYTAEVTSKRMSQSIENSLRYKNQLLEHLNIDILVGQSFFNERYKWSNVEGRDFPSNDFVHLGDATTFRVKGSRTQNALVSYFGRLLLNWNNKYMLSSSLRQDSSSKFAKNNRTDIFPSVAVAWTFTNEDALQLPQWLSYGKFRLSWGSTGNQEGIGNFDYLSLASGGYNYEQKSGLAISSPGSKDLKWETSYQYNVGLDFSLIDNRINITYDFFDKKTDDLLYDVPTLSTSGFSKRTMNIGSMKNVGHEIAINTKNIKNDNFSWDTSFNISFIENEVTKLIDQKPIQVGGWNAIIVGQPLGVFYAHKQEGIFQKKSEIPTKMYGQGVRPGDMKYLDVDGNGIINSSDLVVLGSPQPKFFGGITNTFTYKAFDASIFFNYVYGNKIATVWRKGLDHLGGYDYNMISDSYKKRWVGEGTSNKVPRATKGGYNMKNSDYYLEDGSFLKLKNITLGYTLPSYLLQKIGIDRARIYVSASDLLKFTKYTGFDPEASSSTDARTSGHDNLATPPTTSILFGININF